MFDSSRAGEPASPCVREPVDACDRALAVQSSADPSEGSRPSRIARDEDSPAWPWSSTDDRVEEEAFGHMLDLGERVAVHDDRLTLHDVLVEQGAEGAFSRLEHVLLPEPVTVRSRWLGPERPAGRRERESEEQDHQPTADDSAPPALVQPARETGAPEKEKRALERPEREHHVETGHAVVRAVAIERDRHQDEGDRWQERHDEAREKSEKAHARGRSGSGVAPEATERGARPGRRAFGVEHRLAREADAQRFRAVRWEVFMTDGASQG